MWSAVATCTGTNEPGVQTATARVIAPDDTNPANNEDWWAIDVVDAPSLSVGTGNRIGSRAEPARGSCDSVKIVCSKASDAVPVR